MIAGLELVIIIRYILDLHNYAGPECSEMSVSVQVFFVRNDINYFR